MICKTPVTDNFTIHWAWKIACGNKKVQKIFSLMKTKLPGTKPGRPTQDRPLELEVTKRAIFIPSGVEAFLDKYNSGAQGS